MLSIHYARKFAVSHVGLNPLDFGEFLCLMFLWTAIGSYKTIFTLGDNARIVSEAFADIQDLFKSYDKSDQLILQQNEVDEVVTGPCVREEGSSKDRICIRVVGHGLHHGHGVGHRDLRSRRDPPFFQIPKNPVSYFSRFLHTFGMAFRTAFKLLPATPFKISDVL